MFDLKNGYFMWFSVLYIKVNIIIVDVYLLKIKFGIVFLVIFYFDYEFDEGYGFRFKKIYNDIYFYM